MQDLKTKIREVYLPFLLVAAGTILGYTLVRWALDLKLGLLPLKEDLLNYWIPFILPLIVTWVWLNRRIRILNVRGKRGNGYFNYQMAMAVAIAVPTIISQTYVQEAAFDLVGVSTIEDVGKYPHEKYFTIRAFGVNKDSCPSYFTVRSSGRNNNNLNFYLYRACPFDGTSQVWYGVKYHKKLSNYSSDRDKDEEYRNFRANSEARFASYNVQDVAYFERLGYSDDRDGYLEAIKEARPQATGKEQVILVPQTDDFDQRLGNTFPWIFGSFGIGALVVFLMVVFPQIDRKELVAFKKNKPLKEDEFTALLSFFDLRGANKATAILLLLNLSVFVVMVLSGLNVLSPTPKELLDIGGNRRYEVLQGEYWRLLTAVFIHGGVMHLMANLFALGLSGSLLSGVLGSARLIASFVVTGIFASLTSIWWHEDSVGVGASGAIFGLFGIILAFTAFNIYPKRMRGLTWILLGAYAGINLLFGLLGSIDNAAHMGGLISGFMLGLLLIWTDKENLVNKAKAPGL